MALNVPNQLTLARIVLSIAFFFVLSQYTHAAPQTVWLHAAFVIFVVAAATDFLDGYLARKHNWVTPLGRVLDPFADKMLICGAFILLAGPGFVNQEQVNVTGVAPWMVVVIVGRELLVTGLRGFNESQGTAFAASLHGKIKMWVQSVAAPTLLIIVAHQGRTITGAWIEIVKLVLVYLTVIVTALSAIQYLQRSKDALRGA
ncbi:MAG: CDP-diacylglycerol--glycerol-3-phosphate 3-phosphatidyltransferase [Planctomycetota bacterium]|nr:MAG: CDP-diacylglycerol--glycerol-3-phosphate 3-phosphatidyltransferase [Planctomycetota bacterium]